ncbi:Ribulose bisphosphate carboxylase large chain [Ophidiomyces ophidiicola]|nr:Ribulose bisphosphate carboxylase large chain [Ophidiomyces ophidiicola]
MSFPTDDPSQLSFEGDFPLDEDTDGGARRNPRTNAATAASAAGVRALSAQAVAFYFRAPVKAFFRTRVDYMVLARAINPRLAEGAAWSWKTTTPGLLAHAVRIYGWRFIPYQVLPPLVANVSVGAVLYTSYLQILSNLHGPTSMANKRIYPPPSPLDTFTAGFAAGTIQSVIAAPLDAIQARFKSDELLNGKHRSAWHHWKNKLSEIGLRGTFSGWSLSFLKDSFGSALFFCLFETVKSQGYYSFVTRYYGSLQPMVVEKLSTTANHPGDIPVIRPHYALEPCFLMLAGVTASIGQQVVLHPIGLVQSVYYRRLEQLDCRLSRVQSNRDLMQRRLDAYQETFERCRQRAQRAGGWRAWLFRGFLWNTIRQVPSTSAGLVIFELVRRKAASLSPATTANISPPLPPGSSAPIPLRSLSPHSRPSSEISSSLVGSSREKQGARRSPSSSPPLTPSESAFSVWSDTGDLAEQLANEQDPLRIQLEPGLDHGSSNRSGARSRSSRKRVRYAEQEDEVKAKAEISKEAIRIPEPPQRTPSRVETLLAAIMSPGDRRTAQMHGLVGKPLLYFTSVFVSLGVFLFGYDQGVMSGIITGPFFKDYFNQPTRAEIGTMVAILEVGAFISSLCVGKIGDIIGRRRTILYGSIVFFIGGALQTFATGIPMMLVGRIIAGLGVGALSTIVPVYQSEISPPHNRGQLACIEFTGNICGYAASVWVDYFCSFINNHYSWRLPLFLQCVMGALLGFGSLIICESPRWLLDVDHDEEGMVVIANLYGKGDIHNDKARQEYRDIKMDVLIQRQEGERSYLDMFRRYRNRVFIAMSAQAFAQLNGINVISYYAPLVFESAGWVGRNAILMTGINAITYLGSTIPPWYLVDRWGRRPILLSGAVAMIFSLSLIAYWIYLDIPGTTPTMTVVFVMIYNAAFGASWGPIPWLYPPEILPLSIRAKGASLSTATNWAFNWLVGELTPVLQEVIQWRLYLMHAFFCATSFVVVYFLYPETSGVRLEDMDVLFGDAPSEMPTPATPAERNALMGAGSPVPSLDIRRGPPEAAIPGLNLSAPSESGNNGTTGKSVEETSRGEGIGGWITNMIRRGRQGKKNDNQGEYRRVDQDEEG